MTILDTNIYNYATKAYELSGTILDVEDTRLSNLDIENTYVTYERTKDLQKSHNKKAAAWRWIYIVLLTVLIISVMLILLRRQYDYSAIDWILILVVASGMIYMLILYLDIQSRSPIDFDKISPDANTLKIVDSEASVYGISFEDVAECEGDACCHDGTTWDSTLKQCTQPEQFTPIGPRQVIETFNYDQVYTKY